MADVNETLADWKNDTHHGVSLLIDEQNALLSAVEKNVLALCDEAESTPTGMTFDGTVFPPIVNTGLIRMAITDALNGDQADLPRGRSVVSERDKLRGVLSNVLCNAMSYPEKVQPRILTEQNTVREGLLRAVIEASRGRMTDIEWEVATRDARSEGLTDTILASDWLAAHDAEVAAKALEDVAAEWSDWDALSAPEEWLRSRAARIREGEDV